MALAAQTPKPNASAASVATIGGRPRTLQIDFPERRQRQAEEQFTLYIFWKCLWRGLRQPSGELVAAKEHGQKRSCQKVKPLTDS